jgi:uncharacterized membrane protein
MKFSRWVAHSLIAGLLLLAAFVFADITAAAESPAAVAGVAESGIDWKAFLAPFHSVFLHLPIGFVTIALVLEAYSFFRKGESLRHAIGLVLWISAASAAFASLLGVFRAADGGYETTALEFHRYFGFAVSVVTTLIAAIHTFAFSKKSATAPRRKLAIAYRCILFANVGLISIAGHYGGNLTHGSKYLFEDAPDWVRTWAEKFETTIEAPFIDEPEIPDGDTATSGSGTESGGGHFAKVIRPIFEEKCFQCHGEEKQKGDYRMDTIEGLFAAGESELDPIVAKRPLESYLVEVITLPSDDDYVMPPEGKDPLTAEETLAIMRWIWDGADTGSPVKHDSTEPAEAVSTAKDED